MIIQQHKKLITDKLMSFDTGLLCSLTKTIRNRWALTVIGVARNKNNEVYYKLKPYVIT